MQPVQVEHFHADRFTTAILAPWDDDARSGPVVIADHEKSRAEFTIRCDARGLHLEVRVFEPRFVQAHRHADIWRGDCVQLAIDPAFERTPGRLSASTVMLGFTCVEGRPYAHAWKWGDSRPTGHADIPFEFSRDQSGQVYHIDLPWSALPPLSADCAARLGLSLSVNGHDADGPRYDGWGAGIVNGQDASKFGVIIIDRHARGIGAEVINRQPAESHDTNDVVRLDLVVPVMDPRIEVVEVNIASTGRDLVAAHRHPVRSGEHRLLIAIPVALLVNGANDLAVTVAAQPGAHAILNRSLRVVRESAGASVARMLCERVDWTRPELTGSDFAAACRGGRFEEAALGFVRHLRRRPTPHMGYTREFVAKLRAHATPAFRQKATAQIAELLGTGFLGGSHPDGRGTLLAVRPEVLQVAATRPDFDLFARNLALNRNGWSKAATHTSVNIVRFLQAAWPLEECSDESLIPVLGFLATTQIAQWTGARTWDDASHGTAHNWWAYEFIGTWKAGLLFPELLGFAKFRAFFPENFEREIRLLFFSDGFTREISTSYHIGTVDVFFDLARLAALNGLQLSPAFYERLRAAAEVEWKLMQPDGNYPAFGDCFDIGPVVLDRARAMAAMAGIPECKFLAESLDRDWPSPFGAMLIDALNYPSVGEDLRSVYDSLPARAPATLDTALPVSGYYAMRQDWTAHADYAAIEASQRGRIDTSHGHSAIFDLRVSARGRAILMGNGKGPDDHGSPPRLWRVSTAAHSVATADGEEHVPLRSIYRFAREVTPVVVDWVITPEYAYFHGVHEAYNNVSNPIRAAHRKLFYLRGKYWILIDRFTSGVPDAPHVYRQHFQVGVPSRLEADGRCITEGDGGNLAFVPVAGADGEASKTPCPFPLKGYPAPDQLCFTQQRMGHGLMAMLLVPFVGASAPRVMVKLLNVEADDRTLAPHEATGLEIEFGSERHVYVDLHTHWNLPWECGGCRGDRMLFHSACR